MHPRELIRLIDDTGERLGIGPTMVCEMAGVDRSTYHDMRNGSVPRQRTIDKLLAACRKSRPKTTQERWFTIYTNVPITRRKSFHLIEDPHEEIIYRHRHFWACIEFLDTLGVKAYLIRSGENPDAKGFVAAELMKE